MWAQTSDGGLPLMAFIVAVLVSMQRRRRAEQALKQVGHTCVSFGDAAAGVAEASAGAADLLVVDDRLPDVDMAHICDVMRSQPATARIPIVVCDPTGLTGYQMPPHDRRVRRSSLQSA